MKSNGSGEVFAVLCRNEFGLAWPLAGACQRESWWRVGPSGNWGMVTGFGEGTETGSDCGSRHGDGPASDCLAGNDRLNEIWSET